MEPVHETNTSIGLSPVRLYHLDSKSDTWNCKGTKKCFHNFMFHWHGDETCRLNVICSHLGSHICADHGIILQNDKDQNICHTDEIFETSVSNHSSLNVRLWHTFNAHVNIMYEREIQSYHSKMQCSAKYPGPIVQFTLTCPSTYVTK